jgi:hypothetical protein
MTSAYFILPYLVLSAALVRALLVGAKVVPPACRHCGRSFERRTMGEPVCRCS